jgi:hypothetical protein
VCNAQVRSLARERLALIVALACNSLVHTHRPIIVPHRRSSYKASCVHPRSSWRTPCIHIVALHSYRRTCLHSPFTHRSSRLLSLASVLRSPRSSSRTYCVRCAIIALLVVAHVLENALRGSRSDVLFSRGRWLNGVNVRWRPICTFQWRAAKRPTRYHIGAHRKHLGYQRRENDEGYVTPMKSCAVTPPPRLDRVDNCASCLKCHTPHLSASPSARPATRPSLPRGAGEQRSHLPSPVKSQRVSHCVLCWVPTQQPGSLHPMPTP